ncbi:MAG: hypothetical protein HY561_01965 [Gemmatimonadetes bacterium]|nr:hypothetical protein [Gemmatimonadota bacterium]
MVPVMSLWLPILLSAVVVFIASTIIHMWLPYHRTDYAKAPGEDDLMEALRRAGVAPGDYVVPHAGSMAAMKDPAFVEKMKRGPIAIMTVMAGREPSMAKNLVQWFIFLLVVAVFAAYIAGRALGPGAEYLSVFRFAGATAFVAYTLAGWPESIWYQRKWSTTIKNTLDGLVYGLLTGGMFGALWPA